MLGASACGGHAETPTHQATGPSWTDVFASTPDIYAVVRPQALKSDRLYGQFWRSLVSAAQARGLARGATMLEAVEGSQEIIFGLNQNEAAVVMRGVPARLDPSTIQDDGGQPLFRATSEKRVAEFELIDKQRAEGSLFVLPDRTWVGALGAARDRARGAFAAPMNQPAPSVSSTALVSIRFGGHFLRLFERHPLFGPLTKKLTSATFELQPGRGGGVIALAYSEADAAAYGEMQAKKIAAELGKSKERAWIKDAKIAYEGNIVFVRLDVPPRLLEELPNAKGDDLGL